jgi:hypothetical protein
MKHESDRSPESADPWRIAERRFPAQGTLADRLRFLVGYAVLATSHLNTQPWRFRVGAGELDLFADPSRALPVADPDGRLLTIGCGAALFNLYTAAHAFGLATRVRTLPDPARPDWLAHLEVSGECAPTDRDEALLAAMRTRHTHRGELDPGEPSPSLLRAVAEAVARHRAVLTFVRGDGLRESVADLVGEAEAALWSNDAFCEERDRWLFDRISPRRDGIPRALVDNPTRDPGFAVPEWSIAVGAGPTPASHAARQAKLAGTGGILAVLGTEGDGPGDWLAAGQGLKHGVLLARGAGIWAAYHAQPTQLPAFRRRLSELLPGKAHPQMLIRLGHGYAPPQTPRRPVSEVLVSG